MSLARFMELGLMHPQHGYYSTKDKIFNKGGDFTTSPEISQMFGESLGIWIIAALQNNFTAAEGCRIVEVGPGSGLMMEDVLRTVAQFTGQLKNLDIALIEASPNLAKQQQERLLDLLQKQLKIFLSYELQPEKKNKSSKETPTGLPGLGGDEEQDAGV